MTDDKKKEPKKVKKPKITKGDLLAYAHLAEAAKKQNIKNNRGGK